MSKINNDTALAVMKSTHLARDAVLFSLASVASVMYYPYTIVTFEFFMWLIIDLVGFILLWIPREPIQQIGYAWAGLMSIALLLLVFTYSGNTYLVGGLIMILLLCIFELLAVIKTGYDILKEQARSWTDDA